MGSTLPGLRWLERLVDWRNLRIASPGFQSWASRFPLTRRFARRDAERLYDIVAGFTYSQTLLACVELGVLEHLKQGARSKEALAALCGLTPERMERLCQASAALGLLARLPDGRYRLGRLGAAALGAPGLRDMIRHHAMFYRDLSDPTGLLRDEVATELSDFWAYVSRRQASPEAYAAYSALMASSQAMVAEETLRAVSFSGVQRLLDVGGGEGAFLSAAGRRHQGLKLTLFDLPDVAAAGRERLLEAGLAARAEVHEGDFLRDPLPAGADAVSLVRVLYDHDDDVARRLLEKAWAALPAGGLLIVSEPMSGGARPSRAGDVYFGFYTLAMTSGRPRSAARHGEMLRAAGFRAIRHRRAARAFITDVVTARK